jgi:exodeoxyribonuclease-3
VRVMSYNVKDGGLDRDGSTRLDLIAEVIRALDPDVVVLQEANAFEARGQRARFELEGATGMRSLLGLSPSGYHGGLLVREPNYKVLSWYAESPSTNRVLTAARVLTPGGTRLRVAGVHLDPFSAEARLLGVLHAVSAPPGILMGDFNVCRADDPGVAAGLQRLPAFYRVRAAGLDGRVDDRPLQAAEAAGYIDLFQSAHPGEQAASFPSVGVRFDFIFATPDLAERLVRCDLYDAPPAARASDHLPIYADIDLS